MVPSLTGLGIIDNDGKGRTDSNEGGLQLTYWERYEAENYFVTPDVLRAFVLDHYKERTLFQSHRPECDEVLDGLIVERIFAGSSADFATWKAAPSDAARLIWEARTMRIKLSDFAEEFFRRLAEKLGHAMLLRKGSLHQLLDFVDAKNIAPEVTAKLDLLESLFKKARTVAAC